MWMRTEDVAALGQLYLGGGTWHGRRVLPEGWAELATARHVANDEQPDTDPAGDWAQGYGFQFWRSRWGYRGDGALGQFCIVLPDEEVVVAITSGTTSMHRQLAIVFEHLRPALHPEPLVPDHAAHDALVARLDALRIAPSPFSPPSASPPSAFAAAALDGKRVRFAENPFGLREAHLELGVELDRLTLVSEGWSGTVELGHGAWATTVLEDAPRLFAPGAQEPDGTPLVLCAAGTWSAAEHESAAEYEIAVLLPSGPYRASFRLRFTGAGAVADGAGADVPGADVAGADVPEVDIAEVDVPGADVAGAVVTGADGAAGDAVGVEVDGRFTPDFRAPTIPTIRGRLTADLSAMPEPGW